MGVILPSKNGSNKGIFRDLILLEVSCRSRACFDSPARPTTHTEVEVEFRGPRKESPTMEYFWSGIEILIGILW